MRHPDSLADSQAEWLSQREPAIKLLEILARNHLTMGVVDGCGGQLLNQLTIPGATKAFRMGVIASNWQTKVRLGVPEALLHQYGEISLPVTKYLAQLALNFHSDQIGLAVAGDFVAVAKLNGQVWGTRLLFPGQEKPHLQHHQFAISQTALSLAYMYIQGHHQHETNRYRLAAISPQPIDPNLTHKMQEIADWLTQTNQKIATMESCTGGALACAIETMNPDLLQSAWVTYDEDAKIKLGVQIETMAYGNVYSEQVALAMAQAIQTQTGAAIALATTGTMDTADTRPFHTDTPPGTVYTAIVVKGLNPVVSKLKVSIGPREKMKALIVNKIIEDLSHLLSTTTFSAQNSVEQTSIKNKSEKSVVIFPS